MFNKWKTSYFALTESIASRALCLLFYIAKYQKGGVSSFSEETAGMCLRVCDTPLWTFWVDLSTQITSGECVHGTIRPGYKQLHNSILVIDAHDTLPYIGAVMKTRLVYIVYDDHLSTAPKTSKSKIKRTGTRK